MGEGARVEELVVSPGLCVAVDADSGDLRSGGTAMRGVAGTMAGSHLQLLGLIRSLEAATELPDAFIAVPARMQIEAGAAAVHGLITRIRGLADRLDSAAANYDAMEGGLARLFSGATRAGAGWRDFYGTWLPSPRRLVAVPLGRLATAASRAQMTAQQRSFHGARPSWVGLRSTAVFSGVAYAAQLNALGLGGWIQYQRDLRTVGGLLPVALAPVGREGHPGVDREQGAALARALSGVVHPGGDVDDGALLVSGGVGLTHWALGHQRIRMGRPVVRTHSEPVRTFAGAVAVMEELEVDETTEPGSLRIDRITSAEDEVAWQVFIPGGQGFDPSNVHTLLHAPAAVASQTTPSVAMVAAALRDVGATKGEPIVLVGHSHGGITGSLFASNPRLRAEFDVPLVVTAASPIDRHEIRPDTHVVAIEHTEDPIPGLDGVEHQFKLGLTRVERTLADSHDPATAAGSGIYHSHDYPNYVRTAELVDAHPRLQHLRDYYAAIIPEGEVETFVFRAEIR